MARNPKWAHPISMVDVPNLFQVTKSLFRSAQPTGDGFLNLKKAKFKTILDLRALHKDPDTPGITEIDQEMTAWRVEDEDVIYTLRTIKNAKGKILIHCRHGADRTGCMIAMYRIVIQGWSKPDAIDEMENGGFGFHSVFKNIPKYINESDVEMLREEVNK